MTFASAIKDYIDLINNVYDSVSSNINLQLLISQTFFYIFGSIKYILYYFLSFQWFRDLTYLPIVVPQISTSILKETFFLEGPLSNFFTFLETPIYGNNKFLIGFLNSFFLSLPISATHLICTRRLLIQGIPAGIAAGLGTIIGQTWFLFCVLFGVRLFIIPWFSLEPLSYIVGIIFILSVVYDMVHERALRLLSFSNKTTLLKIFFINFILSWTEQTVFCQYFGNLTFSSEPTILEISSATSELQFILIHGSYLFGILIGSIVFTTLFGWFCLRFSNFLLQLSNFRPSTWINQLNTILLTTIIAYTFTSIPFYGLDYLLASSFGFVSQDKAFEKTFLAPITIGDTNKMLGENSSYKSLDTDISSFDRGQYLRFDSDTSFEELNYQGEYAWTARQDRRGQYRNDRFKKLIAGFFQKTNQNTPTSTKSTYTDTARVSEKKTLNDRVLEENNHTSNKFLSKGGVIDKNSLNSNSNTAVDSLFGSQKDVDADDLYDYDSIDEINNIDHPNLSFFSFNERINEDSLPDEILEPFFNESFSDKSYSEFSKTIFPVLEKKIKQKYYSNPIYKLLLNVDIDFFISRQPSIHSLTQKEENQLFEKRLMVANYYDSLRYYNKLPYVEDFQNFFSGSKSYADRIYNHQFKGTLKIIRRLFSITLNPEQNPQQKRVLKFDQPLYKNNVFDKNSKKPKFMNSKDSSKGKLSTSRSDVASPIYHEELELKKSRKNPFIQLTNPTPFYTGWDEKLRKLVITNRLLPRNSAGFSIEKNNIRKESFSNKDSRNLKNYENKSDLSHEKIDFSSWPIPKNILEKSKSQSPIPYTVMFESLNDPNNEIMAERLKEMETIDWQFNTVPPTMKKIDIDKIKEIAPPTRGGFLWPGHSYLKFDINSLLKTK